MKILSIGIVAYNEDKFLQNLLDDIRSQKYPHKSIEILLIDSMSSDKTRSIMNDFKKNNIDDFYSLKVLENPKKIQAAGWNIAINEFTGDVLARIDAHTKLTPEYSSNVMKNILEGEYVIGGIRPCIIDKNTSWARILLQVENSLFGSGINLSRHSNEKSYVKTMFHASYRREVFETVGLFNEKLLRTEDNEMHYRIRKAGYKLCYDPSIISYQYVRSSFRKMIIQKYNNGLWIGITSKVCLKCLSVYHFAPVVFLLLFVISFTLALFGAKYLFELLCLIYLLFAIINTILSCKKYNFNILGTFIPFMFFILHISYGLGTLFGFLRKEGI